MQTRAFMHNSATRFPVALQLLPADARLELQCNASVMCQVVGSKCTAQAGPAAAFIGAAEGADGPPSHATSRFQHISALRARKYSRRDLPAWSKACRGRRARSKSSPLTSLLKSASSRQMSNGTPKATARMKQTTTPVRSLPMVQ